jgi:hypothetical protein
MHFYPDFATDRTAFAAVSQRHLLRSEGGSPWQEIGPPGEWALSAFHVSPAFHRDRLLFLRTAAHVLWRSTDGGTTWQEIAAPWPDGESPMGIAPGESYRLPAVTFSPSFAADEILFTQVADRVYRSTDLGTTWAGVLELDPGPARATFSPAFAGDGTVYLLRGNTLYRSADRGATWQALPAAPWGGFDGIQIELSPAFPEDKTLLAWNFDGDAYVSSDGGLSWRAAGGGLPGPGIRQVLFSPAYARDGTIYAVPHQGGIYRRTGEGPWLPVTEPVPTATRSAAASPTPPPTRTAAPPSCTTEPDRFEAVWQQEAGRLGCPAAAATQLDLAEQAFEHGQMIWDSEARQIYVLVEAGTWQVFDDTWQEGIDPIYDPSLPSPPRQPQRGFGKVWHEALGGPKSSIGWALADERAVVGWRIQFDHGRLYWTDASGGTAYLLFDDGTWQAQPTMP